MAGKVETFKRWGKMLRGKSVFHMQQCEGKYYKKNSIEGYYSDLRHKVNDKALLDENGVVYNETNKGEKIFFPISIFQYGLGAYDLFLETGNPEYKNKFFNSVRWAINNQDQNGSWNAFGWQNPDKPYSSMAQAEGASLLCRAYVENKEKIFLSAAENAIEYMLKSIEDNGVTRYNGENITFEESLRRHTILNGMIFSIWGLYDVCQLSSDIILSEQLQRSVRTLEVILSDYDCGYWSNYDLDKNIASPFYHDLHIQQLKVMYKLFGTKKFKETYEKWEGYQKSRFNEKRAFIIKASQKLKQINDDIVLVK